MIFNLFKPAREIPFDNSVTGSDATNLQDAIDELHESLLWINQNETADFEAQNIYGMHTANYNSFTVFFRRATNSANMFSIRVLKNKTTTCSVVWTQETSTNPIFLNRNVRITDEDITFTDCMSQTQGSMATTNNTRLIPVQIIGHMY